MKNLLLAASLLASLSLVGCKKGASDKAGTNAEPAAADNGAGESAKPAEGQPAEGQPAEGQPVEGQPAEGQPAEGQPAAAGAVDQSNPAAVMTAVFAAAKSGDTAQLAGLCADSADGDSKDICGMTKDSPKFAQFQKYFAAGAVQGEPRVSGDSAEVDFTFGPDGKKKETMKMTQKDGKWYLSSF